MTPEQQVELILGTLFPDAFIADRSGPARRDEALTLIAPLLAEERRAGAERALREAAHMIRESGAVLIPEWLIARADQIGGQP